MKKRAAILSFFLLFASWLTAEESVYEFKAGAGLKYYPSHHNGYGYAGDPAIPIEYGEQSPPESYPSALARSLGSNAGKLDFAVFGSARRRFRTPLGEGNLLSGGYVDITGQMQLSPVSISITPGIIWEPLPFLRAGAGITIGTGWYWDIFKANGLGLNENADGEPDRNAGGLVLEPYVSLLFQIDTEAFFPGDWHHVVFQAEGRLLFPWYSLADAEEAWIWKNDNGENINGTVFTSSMTLGYLMPKLPLRLLAFTWETESRLGSVRDLSTMSDRGWGSDFVSQEFGPLAVYLPAENHQIIFRIQWATERHYRDDTVFADQFKNRESSDATYVYFKGITLAYTYKF